MGKRTREQALNSSSAIEVFRMGSPECEKILDRALAHGYHVNKARTYALTDCLIYV